MKIMRDVKPKVQTISHPQIH